MSSSHLSSSAGVRPDRLAELGARRRASVQGDEAFTRTRDVALPATQRARRPVVAPQLVEHGAVDPRPRVLLERGAARGVVAIDRPQQRLQAAGDEILDLAASRDLADLAIDDVLDHRGQRQNELVTKTRIPRRAVLLPQLLDGFAGRPFVP